MMEMMVLPKFEQVSMHEALAALEADAFDRLDFGTIGFDRTGRIRVYNRFESEAAGLARDRVVGRPLFDEVAPCMNNFLVAQRFADAAEAGSALDARVDYVLTLRMKPTRVVLRLVAHPRGELSWVLVQRRIPPTAKPG